VFVEIGVVDAHASINFIIFIQELGLLTIQDVVVP
jgi:hypothetical protein